MGLCQSEEERQMVIRSGAIDDELAKNYKVEKKVAKLLLLGMIPSPPHPTHSSITIREFRSK